MAITSEGLRVIGIGHFLLNHFLTVPTYQRSYAWLEDNVDDFWKDIVNALDEHEDDYFIGSIVVSGTNGHELEVVDGQQRLATTMIIFGAIRDYLQANGYSDHAQVYDKYLSDKDEETLEILPKLTLNPDNDTFFRTHIVNRSEDGRRKNPVSKNQRQRFKDSNKRLASAAEKIRNNIYKRAEGRPHEAVSRLKRLAKYLKESVKIISILVSTHENAYTIFETLNDRGLDLSKADLLKNHIYRTAGQKLRVAETKWAEMTGSLESVGAKNAIVDYIRYFWISEHGHVREKNLYSELKKAVIDQAQAIGLVEDLAENAGWYAAILNSDDEHWRTHGEETKHNLSNLIMLGIDRMHPITLAVTRL